LKPFIDESWYMLNYYSSPSRKVMKRVHGAKMLLDLTDGGINRDLFLYGFREPECTRLFRKEVDKGMKIADIGANIGYYVLMESQLIGNSGNIYAIEPAPINFNMLKINIEMNPYAARVTLFNVAISNKIGKALFTISSHSNHHKLSIASSDKEKQIVVETTTLDELLGGKEIDMVRMDPEGAEWLIIKGMEKILSCGKPLKLFIEVHPKLIKQYGGDVEAMLNLLAEAGFKLKYLVKWEPATHFLVPYIKGKGPAEKSIAYNLSLKDFLGHKDLKRNLVPVSGHTHEAGYKIFLERGFER